MGLQETGERAALAHTVSVQQASWRKGEEVNAVGSHPRGTGNPCPQSDAEQDTGPNLAQEIQGLPPTAGNPSAKWPQNTLSR